MPYDSPPEVSVIVVNYNRRDLLDACLKSLANQEDVSFEVVLVDNGSSDGSVDMVRQSYAYHPRFHLHLIRNDENRGFCAANNQGIQAAKAPFIALLNNDAEAEPGWLKALLAVFKGQAEVGMAASKILSYEDPSRIDKAGHLIFPDGQNRGRGTGEIDHGQYDKVAEVAWPDGCAAMYRKELFDDIGGFDEDLFAYGDDAELGLRGRIAAWSCLYAPKAVVRHHRGATLGVRSARRIQLIERNRLLLAAKLFPWSLLWLNGVYYLVRVGAGLWAAMRGKGEAGRFPGVRGKLQLGLAMLKGDWEALKMLPKTLRKRRQLASIRRLSNRQIRMLLRRHRIPLRALSEQTI